MAFDAGMLAASVFEINNIAVGGRIDRIAQPSRDEVVMILRTVGSGGARLLINAGPNNPRIGFTAAASDNPERPPMFCVLLRKHLSGARICAVRQYGFERAVEIELAARDDMGFDCSRFLIAEVMGKYSNLILTDGNKKIISALKIVDFTTSSKRQVLPGMTYELPPLQNKLNPLEVSRAEFNEKFRECPRERAADKFITAEFLGISATIAREIVFRATRHTDTPLLYCDCEVLGDEFFSVFNGIRDRKFSPTLVSVEGKPIEFAFTELRQYGSASELRSFESVGELLDAFYGERDRHLRTHQRAADIFRLVANAETRINRKLEAQRAELADCERGAEFKRRGDLIMANIYKLSRGDKKVSLTDYSAQNPDGSFAEVEIELDERLSPSANAQRQYKKYTKTKTAQVELAKQIKLGEAELEYIYSVFDALTHAETAADLAEIRDELYQSGYASKMKSYTKHLKTPKPVAAKFITPGGFTVLCGKNNLQNEYVTFKLADRDDWWFHVKKSQGSHAVLVCNGREPGDEDFTAAAEIAAFFSRKAEGENVEVDYTKVRNVKKPASGKPGLVIYHTNWSCIVTPSEQKISSMRSS